MKGSNFQIIFLGVCIFLAIAGLLYFAAFKASDQKSAISIVIWGTLPNSSVNGYITQLTKDNEDYSIAYVQKRADTFDQAFLEALASGTGPDALLVSQDTLLKYRNKIVTLPYSSLSKQAFKDTYISAAEVYLNSAGTLALPFSIDPLVMYWNRDLFTNAQIALPPKTWDEFNTVAPQITQRQGLLNITQSAVGLGEFRNITHAKEIVSLLMMQSGNPIVVANDAGYFSSVISSNKSTSALTFFTQFANPDKEAYSWNRSLAESKNLFLANKLGVYFGYASELAELKAKNPNLNFSVAVVPQLKPTTNVPQVKMTYGGMYGLSIVRNTKSVSDTAKALIFLTSKEGSPIWNTITGLPSVRRDSVTSQGNNEASGVFATSALWARAWPDPNGPLTNKIFQDMVENVTSGRLDPGGAVSQAQGEIQNVINKQ